MVQRGDRRSPAHQSPGDRRSTRGLLLELAVIFVGVLGAFFAEDVRQQIEDDRRAEQIYSALHGELDAFLGRVPTVVGEMGQLLDGWNASYEAGNRPAPPFYREPRAEAPPTAIWEATLASGGVALLDPELFNALAGYYNRLSSVIDRYMRYNEVTEREVMPKLHGDPSVFYDDQGALLGPYRTHMIFLAEIRLELLALAEEGQELIQAVAEVGLSD